MKSPVINLATLKPRNFIEQINARSTRALKDSFTTSRANVNVMNDSSSGCLGVIFNLYYKFLSPISNLSVKLCKFDTPEVMNCRKECFKQVSKIRQTVNDNSAERLKLRREIVSEFLNKNQQINKSGNLHIVLGLSGTGKSVLSKKIAAQANAFHIDVDSVCERIPEYKSNPQNYYAVFLEGDKLRKEIFNQAVARNYDIVYEDVGLSYKELAQLCKKMKALNYAIHIDFVDLPLDKSVDRLMARYRKNKRFVDPLFNYIMQFAPKRAYDKLTSKASSAIKSCSIYSSDVQKGEDLVLLHRELATHGQK